MVQMCKSDQNDRNDQNVPEWSRPCKSDRNGPKRPERTEMIPMGQSDRADVNALCMDI